MFSASGANTIEGPPAADSRDLRRGILALIGIVVFGTLGFALIEGWKLWLSLYFTLITITTVGYGDEGLSPQGKVFAAVLVLCGIGVATYTLSLVVQTAVAYQFAWRKKMQQQINQLSGHVIVCGFGRMGQSVCHELIQEDATFVVVEPHRETFERAVEHGQLAIHGNAAEDEILLGAGVERASCVVCVANSDAENVFITLSTRELNEKARIISRADADETTRKLQRAGASHIVSPHRAAGVQVASMIVRPHLEDLLCDHTSSESGFGLREVEIQEGSPLARRTIREFGMDEPNIVFVAIKQAVGETIVRPIGTTAFQTGDVVIVAGNWDDISRMNELAGAGSALTRTLAPSD